MTLLEKWKIMHKELANKKELDAREEKAKFFFHIIDFDEDTCPRYRSSEFRMLDDKLCIMISARCGGGNREEFPHTLWDNQYFIEESDWAYDETYLEAYFSIPTELYKEAMEVYEYEEEK